MSIKIFFVGATGYIGGSVLVRLLEHPKRDSFDITILLRSPEKAQEFESFGLKTVIGSLNDAHILERESAESDVVYQCADSDSLDGTKAILNGLKVRYDKTNTPPILIHTSGTGVLIDNALGKYATETIYSDLNIAQIESLKPQQPHRTIDLTIVDADNQGYVKAYIVLPPTIWALASNAFTEKGLQNPRSQQIPGIIGLSISRGKGVQVGEGLNVWPHINIEELADFYYILFDSIISGENPSHGREGYYFLENGEYSQKQITEVVAAALYKAGKVDSDKPIPLTEEELKKHPIAALYGTNSRCRAERSRSLGWTPVKTTEDLIASLDPEVASSLKKN